MNAVRSFVGLCIGLFGVIVFGTAMLASLVALILGHGQLGVYGSIFSWVAMLLCMGLAESVMPSRRA